MFEHETQRYIAAQETVNTTLSFIGEVKTKLHTSPAIQQIYGRIEDFARTTDFVDLSTMNTEQNYGAVSWHSDRYDYESLPPTNLLFQAMPGDQEIVPPNVKDALPGLHEIINRQITAQIVGLGSCGAAEVTGQTLAYEAECMPIMMMAEIKHDLTKAIVGMAQLDDLRESVDNNYPAEAYDPDHVVYPLFNGLRYMNRAALIAGALSRHDDTGDVREWLNKETQVYADCVDGGGGLFEDIELPTHTVLGEAIQEESFTMQILRFSCLVNGIRSSKKAKEWNHEQLSHNIHSTVSANQSL